MSPSTPPIASSEIHAPASSGASSRTPERCRGPGGPPRGMRIWRRVWLCSVRLGAVVPVGEIHARGLPGTATCCFEHDLQLRRFGWPCQILPVIKGGSMEVILEPCAGLDVGKD